MTPRHSDHPNYWVWVGMRQRCTNKRANGYKYYGGRGITVCDRWTDFESFTSDMGARPSPNHSIDRINNDKGYEPGNCRWATPKEQATNKRKPLLAASMRKDVSLTIHANGELTARLRTLAAADRRTLSSYVALILEDYLKQQRTAKGVTKRRGE